MSSGIGMGHILMYSADWVFLNLTRLKHMNFIQLHFAIVFSGMKKQLVLKNHNPIHTSGFISHRDALCCTQLCHLIALFMLTPKIVNPLLTLQKVLGYVTSICSLVQAAWSSAGVSLSLWDMWPWRVVYTSVGSEPEDRGRHGVGRTWRSVLLHRLRGWWVSGWNKVKGTFVKSSCCQVVSPYHLGSSTPAMSTPAMSTPGFLLLL